MDTVGGGAPRRAGTWAAKWKARLPLLLASLAFGCGQDSPAHEGPVAKLAFELGADWGASEEPCQEAACCPSGQAVVEGSDAVDHVVVHDADTCVVVHGGGDHVIHNAHGAGTVFGGAGDDFIRGPKGPGLLAGGGGRDHIVAGKDDDLCYGGTGDDRIQGGSGNDRLHGNAGDDDLKGQNGDDVLIPGPGRDTSDGGSGNDTLVVYDICELEAGEVLDGGAGHDTLVIPVPLEEVEALGVTVLRIETIVVDPQPCLSECTVKNRCDGALVEGDATDELFCCGDDPESILPGAGADHVEAGGGDDIVVIQDVCQLAAGEVLDGQDGHDTLITPISVAELEAAGVTVRGFEEVQVGALDVNCDAACVCDEPTDICPEDGSTDPEVIEAREICLSTLDAFRSFLLESEDLQGETLASFVESFPAIAANLAALVGSSHSLGPTQDPMPPFSEIDTSLDTCDRPELPILPSTLDCDQGQTDEINLAFNHADFLNWRSQQIMGAVLEPDPELDPEEIWNAGTESDNFQVNSGFRAWFGTFSEDKAQTVAQSLALNRNTLSGPKNVACWDDPCPTFLQCAGNWLARPLTTARRLSSPCAWTGSLAHSFYSLYDALTLPFPTLEVCFPFFSSDASEQGGVLLHEWLHWKSNDEGSLRDRFSGDGCSGDCQAGDSIGFARDDSPLALRNIRNTQWFQETYGRAYLENRCEARNLFCFPPQTLSGTCDEPGDGGIDFPEPSETCQDEGICAGRPCFETDHNDDPANQFSAAHPDGDALFHYCDVDAETSDELTCIVADRDEALENGICVACGTETMMGCSCDFADDCTVVGDDPYGPLHCFGGTEAGWPAGSGFCWPDPVPEHQCEFNCVALADRFCGGEGDCEYVCDHEAGACLTTSPDIFSARTCWEDQQIPDEDGGCQPQCLDDCDCTSAFGYPFNAFACVANVCEPCFNQSCENTCE